MDYILTTQNIQDFKQNLNPLTFFKSIEIVYGLRNFIGNANKYAKENIFITVKSDEYLTNIVIEDDVGNCYKYKQNKISCEENKDKITTFPVQYESTEEEREEDKPTNKIFGIF